MHTIPTRTTRQLAPYRKIGVILIGVAICIGSLLWWLTELYNQKLTHDLDREVASELRAKASSLSLALNNRIRLADGLKAFVDTEVNSHHSISADKFNTYASSFLAQQIGIRNLSIYPNGISEFVYPLEHNEAMIGLDLFNHPDPVIVNNAIRTRDTTAMTILGPMELQGSSELITRQAVLDRGQFWGFVSVVLDIPSIFEEAGLLREDQMIQLAVRSDDQIIIGDSSLFEKATNVEFLNLPEGSWKLVGVPTQQSLNSIHYTIMSMQFICFLSLLLVLYFLYVQYTQKAKLQVLLEERTQNVHHLSYYDSVTGLYNRNFFIEKLTQMIESKPRSSSRLAVLFMDMDHFKMINDSLGHSYGDQLLYDVGQRLLTLRDQGLTIARFGGDEFVIIISNVSSDTRLNEMTSRLFQLFQEPFILNENEHFITVSIGIALYPDHGSDALSLLKNTELAMYHSKSESKNNYSVYHDQIDPQADYRMYIKNSLNRALQRNEFFVHYQPQVEATSGRIVGMEALIRWNHPKKGMIPPSVFIPIAEESGMIIPIGERVLQIACAQSKAWQLSGLPPIRVAVNLSARQFSQKNLAERIKYILSVTELDPKNLELEITENMAMKDDNLSTLHELREMGITISIDDFGTQYSSLSYLKRLPVNKIKIDRSFVNGIAVDQKDEAIIMAMLLIARRLDLTVIAEGVETEEQYAFLRDNDCNSIQGYLFHKPQPPEQIKELLLTHT
ncbi:MAG: EAL domain-containing protein [Candidatus Cohnella colombiensis]|uniref:EAL domain-containing protein n=1 Tax=Candidatus Cohnella colombiensis TaxID=3121368 RepID=A0AA95JBG0_9BACL|nr:MAG: EAL domain-containing protein [Cohnella sp.]